MLTLLSGMSGERRSTAGIDFLQAKLEAEKPSAGLRESRAIGIRQDGGLHAQIL